MGFSCDFGGNSVSGPEKVWGFTDYGLWQLWVKTASTVIHITDWKGKREK
jgi:hypothetical protein